jgi:hypothetical protein
MLYDLAVWTLQMLALGALLFAAWAVGAGRIVRAAKPVPQLIVKHPVGFMPSPA